MVIHINVFFYDRHVSLLLYFFLVFLRFFKIQLKLVEKIYKIKKKKFKVYIIISFKCNTKKSVLALKIYFKQWLLTEEVWICFSPSVTSGCEDRRADHVVHSALCTQEQTLQIPTGRVPASGGTALPQPVGLNSSQSVFATITQIELQF